MPPWAILRAQQPTAHSPSLTSLSAATATATATAFAPTAAAHMLICSELGCCCFLDPDNTQRASECRAKGGFGEELTGRESRFSWVPIASRIARLPPIFALGAAPNYNLAILGGSRKGRRPDDLTGHKTCVIVRHV